MLCMMVMLTVGGSGWWGGGGCVLQLLNKLHSYRNASRPPCFRVFVPKMLAVLVKKERKKLSFSGVFDCMMVMLTDGGTWGLGSAAGAGPDAQLWATA